jgi:threonine dehydratase
MLATLEQLEAAAEQVYRVMAPTMQHNWPLLSRRCGCEVWVKHESQTPIGAFKIRGGIVFMQDLAARGGIAGVITATRGNHGQSIGLAARAAGLPATIVVPEGNSREKNAAMAALGVDLVVHGADFDAARDHAAVLAEQGGLAFIPAFHPLLVRGVGTYSLEFLRAVAELDTVYVPIGQGSGICGMIAARDALGLTTDIVGVVSERAAAYALSFEAGRAIATNSADTFADGVACRTPDAEALDVILRGAARIVAVSEVEIAAAMRAYFTDTHNIAEGAGAVPLAALLKEREAMAGRRVGLVLSGGNIDREVYLDKLAGG